MDIHNIAQINEEDLVIKEIVPWYGASECDFYFITACEIYHLKVCPTLSPQKLQPN